jgi:hypothetical protein
MEQPEIQELRTELSDLTTAIEGLGYDLERAVMIGRMLTHSRLSAAQLSEADEDIQPPLWVNDAGNARRGFEGAVEQIRKEREEPKDIPRAH